MPKTIYNHSAPLMTPIGGSQEPEISQGPPPNRLEIFVDETIERKMAVEPDSMMLKFFVGAMALKTRFVTVCENELAKWRIANLVGSRRELPDVFVDDLIAILRKDMVLSQYLSSLVPPLSEDALAPIINQMVGNSNLTKSESSVLNSLVTLLGENSVGLQNTQFHTDSLACLAYPRGDFEACATVKRFYAQVDDFQAALRGEKHLNNPEFDASLRARLVPQLKSAIQFARTQGITQARWFPGGRMAGPLSVHAGWIPKSFPTACTKAVVVATRTLGLTGGDRTRLAKVELDLSSLGLLTLAQAKAILIYIQNTSVSFDRKEPVKGFDNPSNLLEEPKIKIVNTLCMRFVKTCHSRIEQMHAELNGRGAEEKTEPTQRLI